MKKWDKSKCSHLSHGPVRYLACPPGNSPQAEITVQIRGLIGVHHLISVPGGLLFIIVQLLSRVRLFATHGLPHGRSWFVLFIMIRHHGYCVFPNFVSCAKELLNLRGLRVFVACWSEGWGLGSPGACGWCLKWGESSEIWSLCSLCLFSVSTALQCCTPSKRGCLHQTSLSGVHISYFVKKKKGMYMLF